MALHPFFRLGLFAAFALSCGLTSCGKSRLLVITSEPSGALIRLDEDVIGTTPLEHSFQHFGKRRLSLYLAGYQSYSEPIELKAPWHARFPTDIFTEVLLPFGWSFEREVHVALEPDDGQRVLESLDSFVDRAESLRRNSPVSTGAAATPDHDHIDMEELGPTQGSTENTPQGSTESAPRL